MVESRRRDLPVLLLHNVSPGWTAAGDRAKRNRTSRPSATRSPRSATPSSSFPSKTNASPRVSTGTIPATTSSSTGARRSPASPTASPRSRPSWSGSVSSSRARRRAFSPCPTTSPGSSASSTRWACPRLPGRSSTAPKAGGWDIFPAIVKTAHEHCSIGISPESVVTSPAELERRVAHVLEVHEQPALVEEFINGREFHVAAWGNGTVTMLPVAEMDYGALTDIRDRLFTYEGKYVPGTRIYEGIELRVPVTLEAEALAALERIVLATYRATGCRDYGRIDLRWRDGIFYVIDVNPNPDINPETSLTCAAAEVGYSYGEMGSRIVNLAAARHPVFRMAGRYPSGRTVETPG
ncbi:MAG: hypothetical protein M0C28_01435 [Candidatus Moduliflexus flocculans]|nr:hypothetical protein [Candidatus Moduliflexus flocculans]